MDGPDETLELMARTGARVRAARARRNWSRQALSDASGVSLRYLAQLEAGAGNISIGRLDQVARALGDPVDWFLREEDPWSSDEERLRGLMRGATADARARAMDILAPPSRARRIALIGLRGAGKSTLGAGLARSAGLPFVQLNAVIAEEAGMPVPEIMALYGPEGYRMREAVALDRVAGNHDAVVLEAAGGVVAEADTFAALTERFHTIWIRTTPEEHMARVRAQGDLRPMAGNAQAMDQLRDILKSREPLYGRAAARLDTSGITREAALAALTALVEREGFLRSGP